MSSMRNDAGRFVCCKDRTIIDTHTDSQTQTHTDTNRDPLTQGQTDRETHTLTLIHTHIQAKTGTWVTPIQTYTLLIKRLTHSNRHSQTHTQSHTHTSVSHT